MKSSVFITLVLSLVAFVPSADSLNIQGNNHRPVSLRDTLSIPRTILPVTIAGSLGILASSSSAAKAASTQFEYQPALQGLDYGKPRTAYPDFTQMVSLCNFFIHCSIPRSHDWSSFFLYTFNTHFLLYQLRKVDYNTSLLKKVVEYLLILEIELSWIGRVTRLVTTVDHSRHEIK